MEISTRGLWTSIHGMGFGGLYLLACSGAIVELWRRYGPARRAASGEHDDTFLRGYLAAMAALAWLAVLSGAYVVYPWYRAIPPAGTSSLAAYPQHVLMSSSTTAGWHSLGMEWKEHVAWLAPISITMAAVVVFRYGRALSSLAQLRNAVLGFVLVSLVSAGIAGFFGAELESHAPVRGGPAILFVRGGPR